MSCCFSKQNVKAKHIASATNALILQLNQAIFKAIVDKTILSKLSGIQKENQIQSCAHFIKDLIQLLNDFYPKWIPATDQGTKNLASDIIITCLKSMGGKLASVEPIKDIIFSHYKTYIEKKIRTFNANTEPSQSKHQILILQF